MTRLLSLIIAILFLIPASSVSQERMTVFLDWFLNPDHAPLVIAHELGYFQDVTLDVELIEPADPNDPPKLIAAGYGQVAISYQPQLHIHADQNLPITRFATLIASPLNSLVVLDDSPIRSLSDLKGRTVGFSVGGFEDAILGAMLQSTGLSLNDVTLVNINFALTPALLNRQVDAVIGAFRNFELNQLALERREGRLFYPEEHGVPPYDELILITHRDNAHDPRLPRFLDALEKAVFFVLNHPEESWKLFIQHRPSLDDDLNYRAWFDTLPRFSLSPGALNPRRYQRFASFLRQRGLIKQIPPLETYTLTLPYP